MARMLLGMFQEHFLKGVLDTAALASSPTEDNKGKVTRLVLGGQRGPVHFPALQGSPHTVPRERSGLRLSWARALSSSLFLQQGFTEAARLLASSQMGQPWRVSLLISKTVSRANPFLQPTFPPGSFVAPLE